jgi:DNA replication protein DnaC
MQSLSKALKTLDLDYIKQRAKENKSSPKLNQANTLPPKCTKCNDNEGYLVKQDDYEVWKFCECRNKKNIERSFKSSKITFEFSKKTFDNFDIADLKPIVRSAFHLSKSYLINFDTLKNERKNSICILGNVGSGKTHLLMAIANGLLNKGVNVLYFPWVEGFNEIKDDFSLMEKRVNNMQKVDVLFIDDMWKGRKNPTEFQMEQAFAIINYRYMENKPILISSERTIDEMCDFNEAIGSRINEMCKDFRVIIGGEKTNYRMREE